MSWIKEISEQSATTGLKKLYEQISESRGKVANILKVQSILPETLRAHLLLYSSIVLKENELSRQQKEMIAVTVSALNGCGY